MSETIRIPEPRGLPFLGNIAEFNPESPLQDFYRLADTYGEVFRVNLAGKTVVFVSTNALVHEVCDESRFQKTVSSVLGEVRAAVNDGLFTASGDEPNWGIAHRILVPAFGPMAIRGMFDEMHDIATQLAMKWARHGSSNPIPVSEDFTRLALDTIALCAMDFRFNSYYHEEMHPFIQAMSDFLIECGRRNRRPPFANFFFRGAEQKFHQDIELLRQTSNEVLQARRANPNDRKDLLTAMLDGVDPKTGQKLTDSSITDNLITFLIAGHETTSGLLSFTFYQLIKHPNSYRKAQQEVDEVIGRGPIKVEHLSKLPFLAAVLRETLRLCSTIPAFGLEAKEDTLLAGKYPVKKGEPIVAMLGKSHLDPVVYGEDAKQFKPERMLDENFERLQKEFPDCWKPFGNGMRACIGRPFAWQEALLATAMLLQNFNFVMDDPNYQLQIAESLTIKPKSFLMRASLRHNMTPTELEHRLAGTYEAESDLSLRPGLHAQGSNRSKAPSRSPSQNRGAGPGLKPMSIYYGSNSGTCEALAQRLAGDAPAHGFNATVVDALDAANDKLPTKEPVVIITASYEGQPPDNAAHFVSWLESLKGNELEKVTYATFGCGHHDWVQTFHRIPKLVDSTLEKRGAKRLVQLGLADAAAGDLFSDFETWEDEELWPALSEVYGTPEPEDAGGLQAGLSVEISTPRVSTLRQDVQEALVLEARDLTVAGPGQKKHIEIQLPTGMSYTAGDYLAILPLNPTQTIGRVFRRFQLAWDAHLTISADKRTLLPTNQRISAHDVFSAYVELAQPATKRNILALMEATSDEDTIEKLQILANNAYHDEIIAKRVSVLDLLESFPSVALPIGSFLSMLPPMRIRQYSISSSPLWDPSRVTLTYSILDEPSLSGHGQHVGVATSYLSGLKPSDRLHVAVRPSHVAFHLPQDPERTPIVCIAAGSGIAPFRGFMQQRAAMLGAGRTLAPALLFYGCHSPNLDDIYRDELDRWEKLGAVKVKRAYSRQPEASFGCKHVQDRLYHDKEEVLELWDRGAKVFVCGSREVGKGVEDTCIRIATEVAKGNLKNVDEEGAREWWQKVRNERYATDVFD